MHNGRCRREEKLTCSKVIARLHVTQAEEDSVIAQRWEHERLYTVHDIEYFCQGITMFQRNKTQSRQNRNLEVYLYLRVSLLSSFTHPCVLLNL